MSFIGNRTLKERIELIYTDFKEYKLLKHDELKSISGININQIKSITVGV